MSSSSNSEESNKGKQDFSTQKISLKNGQMPWTVIHMLSNGEYGCQVVYSSIDKHIALEAIRKQFKRLIAIFPGKHPVYFYYD